MKRRLKDALLVCGMFVGSVLSFFWNLPAALSLNLEKKDRIEKTNCHGTGERG